MYCYAEYQKGIHHFWDKWGNFVDVKSNLPDVLTKQVKKLPLGEVFVGSVSDAYQPVEGKYELTRQIIEILLSKGFDVTILTKSALVTRDIDILQNPHCKVCLTIIVLDDELCSKLEPGCSRTSQRLAALHKLSNEGVSTWAYVAPIIPKFTDANNSIERLIYEFAKCHVDFVTSDIFNPFPSSWLRFRNFLNRNTMRELK